MKKLLYISAICLGLFSIPSCVEPLDIETTKAVEVLVVEGSVTTGPGPHRITLQKSAKYGDIFEGFSAREPGATLWIRDEEGLQYFFEEIADGVYDTEAGINIEVGKSYTLSIRLANGDRYISLPETIQAVPEIKNLTPIFKKQPTNDNIFFDSGMEIYATFDDPEDQENFYLWRNNGEYKLNTRPDLYGFKDFFGNFILAPKDCCELCYFTDVRPDKTVNIFKDNLTNGSEITRKVAYIADDGKRFSDKYMVVIEQRSITKEAFQFFNLLQSQLSIDGDIFDPPPAAIRGNLINLNNPDEQVIGYFSASDVRMDTIFITEDQILEKQPFGQINDDCRIFSNATINKPPYWP